MIYFFYGPNSFTATNEINRIIEGYIAKAGSDFGLDRIDGSNKNINDIRTVLQASPFLANSRLVIVNDFGKSKAAPDKLELALGLVPSSTVVIFFDPDVDMRTVYFKTMNKLANVIKFDKLSGGALSTWILKETKSAGGSIDRQTALQLIALAGEDQWRLSGEINKLVSYNKTISKDSINLLVTPSLHQTVFDLVEAMTAGRDKVALKIFGDLIAERNNEIYLLTMVIWQLRNLILAKTSQGLAPNELARETGMSPYVATKSMNSSKNFDESVLRHAFLAAAETEFRIKSGKEPAEPAVERLILEVSSRR